MSLLRQLFEDHLNAWEDVVVGNRDLGVRFLTVELEDENDLLNDCLVLEVGIVDRLLECLKSLFQVYR